MEVWSVWKEGTQLFLKVMHLKFCLADTFDFSPSFQCSNLLSEVLLQWLLFSLVLLICTLICVFTTVINLVWRICDVVISDHKHSVCPFYDVYGETLNKRTDRRSDGRGSSGYWKYIWACVNERSVVPHSAEHAVYIALSHCIVTMHWFWC